MIQESVHRSQLSVRVSRHIGYSNERNRIGRRLFQGYYGVLISWMLCMVPLVPRSHRQFSGRGLLMF